MKTLKLLLVAFLAVVGISSCMKDNDYDQPDYEAENRRIDSTLKAQDTILRAYAHEHFDNPIEDTTFGIWYEILEVSNDTTFEYVSRESSWVPVIADVKYTGQLLDGTVFDDQTDKATQLVINGASNTSSGVIYAWLLAFYPQSSNANSFSGLTEDGLKKGSKIRFVAPSPYCYDNQTMDDIPADSPLDFTIEVTDIRSTQ